jgi:hypothetical protein
MRKHFESGEFYPCRVNDMQGAFTVDGYARQGDYFGHYPDGATLRLEIPAGARRPDGWLVDGEHRVATGDVLEWKVTAPVTITPLYSSDEVTPN